MHVATAGGYGHRVDITIRVEAGGLAQSCWLGRILSVWS
jgi:hypothetical protein